MFKFNIFSFKKDEKRFETEIRNKLFEDSKFIIENVKRRDVTKYSVPKFNAINSCYEEFLKINLDQKKFLILIPRVKNRFTLNLSYESAQLNAQEEASNQSMSIKPKLTIIGCPYFDSTHKILFHEQFLSKKNLILNENPVNAIFLTVRIDELDSFLNASKLFVKVFGTEGIKSLSLLILSFEKNDHLLENSAAVP